MYDLIIIGGGPAGLTAAIYAARFKLDILLLAGSIGGYMNEAHMVENYPGIVAPGMELAKKFEEHVKRFDVHVHLEKVKKVEKKENFIVHTSKENYETKSIIIALGTQKVKLNLPEEDKFLGKGISYCATCDAFFYKDKNVAVVGHDNHAIDAAEVLVEVAKKVYLVCEKEIETNLLAVQELQKKDNFELIMGKKIIGLRGKESLEKIELSDGSELEVDGLFVEIGSVPITALASELGIELDNTNHIVVDNAQKTNAEGIFAAGDITTNSDKFKQIITACAEGAVAARSSFKYVKR